MTKRIKRKPIFLNSHTVMLVHLFDRYDHLEDLWTSDVTHLFAESVEDQKFAAKQLLSQLEGKYTIRFALALRDELDAVISSWKSSRNQQ